MSSDTISVTVTESVQHLLDVADGASDSSISFGGVTTAKVLQVKSDGAVTVKISGGTTAIPVNTLLRIVASASGPTSLTISNGSGASRSVEIFIAG